MFNPKEAEEDFHFLLMAISIILILTVAIYTWSHSFTAIKYKLLKEFGVSSQAVVVQVQRESKVTSENLLRFFSDFSGIFGPSFQRECWH